MFSRRDAVRTMIGSSLYFSLGNTPAFSESPRHPDWSTLESGDLLWPAKPDDRILFSQGENARQQQEWRVNRDKLVTELRATGTPEILIIAEQLIDLSFEDFQTQYFEGSRSSDIRPFSAGGALRVGHVVIVYIDEQKKRWIIEATPNLQRQYEAMYTRFSPGVFRNPFEEWEKAHSSYHIWHGRIDRPIEERAKIAARSLQFVGRDYWLWNLNLADHRSFYCSKPVWLSTWNALAWALDGDANPQRRFWLTPKQLLLSPTIRKLYSPAPY